MYFLHHKAIKMFSLLIIWKGFKADIEIVFFLVHLFPPLNCGILQKRKGVINSLQSWCLVKVGWINALFFFLTGNKTFQASSWIPHMQGLWMSSGTLEKMRGAWNMLNAASSISQHLVYWVQRNSLSLGLWWNSPVSWGWVIRSLNIDNKATCG